DENVHEHPAVERRHITHAVGAPFIAADDPLVGALENADDPPFGASTFFHPLDADDDAIAVHRVVQQGPGNGDVASRLGRTLGRDESVAARMGLQAADIQIHLFRQAEAVTSNLNEITRSDERLDVALEGGAFLAGDLENLKELANGSRM